jgi:hypothetical protein
MNHLFWTLVAVLVLVSNRATAEGINLSWDDCGVLGTSARSFACDTNTGEDRLVLSIQVPAGVDSVCGVTGILTLTTGGFVPEWWKHRAPQEPIGSLFPQCRDTLGLRPQYSPTGCLGIGEMPLLIWGYLEGTTNPMETQLKFGVSYLQPLLGGVPVPVNPDNEYYFMTFVLNHSRTVGTDACAGCEVPACIVFEQVDIVTTGADCVDSPTIPVTNVLQRNYVTWQDADALNCAMSAPARSVTWGQVKSLYR